MQEPTVVGVPSLGEHSTCVRPARDCYLGKTGAAPFPVPSSGPALPASCILIRPQQPSILPHARTVPDGPRAWSLCKLRLGAGLPGRPSCPRAARPSTVPAAPHRAGGGARGGGLSERAGTEPRPGPRGHPGHADLKVTPERPSPRCSLTIRATFGAHRGRVPASPEMAAPADGVRRRRRERARSRSARYMVLRYVGGKLSLSHAPWLTSAPGYSHIQSNAEAQFLGRD